MGNKPHKLCIYSLEPRTEVYCLRHEQLGVFLSTHPPPLGWDASPLQSFPSIKFGGTHLYMHLGGERHHKSKVSCSGTQQCPRPGLKPRPLAPESSALTTRPLCPSSKILCCMSYFHLSSCCLEMRSNTVFLFLFSNEEGQGPKHLLQTLFLIWHCIITIYNIHF